MVSAQILSDIRRHGIELRADGDRLLFRSAQAVPQEVQTSIRTHKAELLRMLRQPEISDQTGVVDVRKLRAAEAEFSSLDEAPLNIVLCVTDPDQPDRWVAFRRSNRNHQGRGDSQAMAVLDLARAEDDLD